MTKDFEQEAKVFKAFCDPNRLEILDVSQSTLSHHMKILTDAKVVNVRKDGKWSHYSLSSNGIKKIIEYLKNYQA